MARAKSRPKSKPKSRQPSRVVGIDHISIRVSDYAKSKAFYGKLFEFLGFEISDEYPNTIGWTNGKTRYWIAPAEGRKSYRIGDLGLHHYAFELRNRARRRRPAGLPRSARACASSIRPTNIMRITTPCSSSTPTASSSRA